MSGGLRAGLLAMLVAAGVINYADRQIIAVLKPLLQHDLGWSDATYGYLASVFQFAAALAYLGAGAFVDRAGLRWGLPAGVAAWSLAAGAHALVRGVLPFAAVRAALGAAEAVNTPAAIKAVAAYWDVRARAAVLGVLNAASNLGAIVSPLALPALALAIGWRGAFVALGAAGLAWAAVWLALVAPRLPRVAVVVDARSPSVSSRPERSGEPGPRTARTAVAPGSRIGGVHPRAGPWPDPGAVRDDSTYDGRVSADGKHPPRSGWAGLLRERRTWAIVGAKALSDQAWWFLLFWAPDLFGRVFHLKLAQLGPPLALVYGLAAVGSLGFGGASGALIARGWSLDRARKGVMLVCALLVAPVALAYTAPDAWTAALLLGLALAGHQGFSTTLFSVIADVTPAARVGSVTSLGAFAGNIAGMAVLALVGLALSRGGGYAPFFAFDAVAYLLALGWLQLLLPRLISAELAPLSAA